MLGFTFPNFPLFPPSKNTTPQRNDFNDLSILCVAKEEQKSITGTIDDSSSSCSDRITKKQTTKRKRLFCKESYITCQVGFKEDSL